MGEYAGILVIAFMLLLAIVLYPYRGRAGRKKKKKKNEVVNGKNKRSTP